MMMLVLSLVGKGPGFVVVVTVVEAIENLLLRGVGMGWGGVGGCIRGLPSSSH